MAAILQRETFTISREVEYLSENELVKQIGYPRRLWLLAVVKELIDNSLDHGEEVGILPEIIVTITADSISVSDNGQGIPTATVAGMLDFTSRASSREAYRHPSRGKQGQAGKCIIAVPYVMCGEEGFATITSQGYHHEIRISLDQLAQRPHVDHHREQMEKVQSGTTVTLHLPCKIGDDKIGQFVLLSDSYASLNPHLKLELVLPGGDRHSWERTSDTCKKWTPAEPDPPHWYDLESFERLVGACITNDRDSGQDRPLRGFLQQFAGLKRSDKLKAVSDDNGLTRANLTALMNCKGLDHQKTASLLEAMKEHGREPKPAKLGAIGRSHVQEVFARFDADATTLKYKKLVGYSNGLPFVTEVAFAELADSSDCRMLITGCNFSPAVERPVIDVDWILERQMVSEESPTIVLIHVTTPAPAYLDRGKCTLDANNELGQAVEETITSVTSDYCRQRKAEERDAQRENERRQKCSKSRPSVTLKDAVVEMLPRAIENASGGGVCEFSDRDLYYAARALIQDLTGAGLSQQYFDQVVDQWERDHGLIDGRLRDPRGFLVEPHSNRRIPLGTKQVEQYEIPLHLYDKIIYVEKKGLLSKFELGKIGQRYDAAIICAEGYAVKAAKALLQEAQRSHRMQVFCFHDADPHGYNIARTLSTNTASHRFEIEVIDAGLHLGEALEIGLPAEKFTRRKAIPRRLKLNELEREYFTGCERSVIGRRGKRVSQWTDCQRVELNALSADPHRFVQWVEAKLQEHGADRKLVPDKDVIVGHAVEQRGVMLRQFVEDKLLAAFDVDAIASSIIEFLADLVELSGIPESVKTWATTLPPQAWTNRVDNEVRCGVLGLEEDIDVAVREAVKAWRANP